jgi:hypothetical protein
MIMIKSIVSSIVAISVLATPVVAEAKSRGDHRAERSERHRGGRVNTGEAIAIGVGALILGAAIGSRRDQEVEREVYDREYDYHYRGRPNRHSDAYYRPARNCRIAEVTEYDYYGNRYIRRERRCF